MNYLLKVLVLLSIVLSAYGSDGGKSSKGLLQGTWLHDCLFVQEGNPVEPGLNAYQRIKQAYSIDILDIEVTIFSVSDTPCADTDIIISTTARYKFIIGSEFVTADGVTTKMINGTLVKEKPTAWWAKRDRNIFYIDGGVLYQGAENSIVAGRPTLIDFDVPFIKVER